MKDNPLKEQKKLRQPWFNMSLNSVKQQLIGMLCVLPVTKGVHFELAWHAVHFKFGLLAVFDLSEKYEILL